MRDLLDSSLIDSAATLLTAEHTYVSDMALSVLYFNNQDFDSAQALINRMDYDDPDFENWKQLFQIQLDIEVDSLTLFDMDSSDYVFVEGLANSGCELSNIQAQTIISFIKGTEFDFCDQEIGGRPTTNYNSNSTENSSNFITNKNHIAYLKVIPNPFSSSSVISYNLLHEEENGRIFLINYTGQIVKEYTITQKRGIFSINASELSKGIYMVTLLSKNEQYSVKVIIN